ncbi:MAG: PDZ domain-containing protein [Myxococcales bacterium]|jgi:hypothetical protein
MSVSCRFPGARALLSLLLTAGCASGATIKVEVKPGKPLEAQALAVFPFQFRWDEPAWRSFELSQALALQAIETGRYSVFGPGEFKLVSGQASNPFLGSDLVLSLADRGLSPMAALVFRCTAERRTTSAVQQVFDSAGKPRGVGRAEEQQIVAALEVFHSASREKLASASGMVQVDPFRAADPSDPLPELTGLVRALMAEVLEQLEDRAPGVLVERDAGFDYLWNPKATLDFSWEGKPPLREALEKADALDKELLLEARLRFFHPDLEPGTLSTLMRSPAGLLVTSVREAAEAGLVAGDLIVGIAGEPALPQALQRALRGAEGTSVALQVRRAGQLVEIRVPIR